MSDGKYICMKCKSAGTKTLVPFKIIEDRNGESVKFRGQLCERCFNELLTPAQNKDNENEETK
jgi:hypothetical protein